MLHLTQPATRGRIITDPVTILKYARWKVIGEIQEKPKREAACSPNWVL